MAFRLPAFSRFIDQLHAAGIKTGTARGFWGGINDDGEIVVTAWTDAQENGRFGIWRPRTNHGGLKDAWDTGLIREGTEVRLILLRQRGNAPLGAPRSIGGAGLVKGRWRVVEMRTGHDGARGAYIEFIEGTEDGK